MKQEKKTDIIELDNISLLDFPTFRVDRAKGYTQKSIEIKGLDYTDLLSYTLGLIDCICLALENNNTKKTDLHSIKTSVQLISHFLPQYEEMDLLDKIALIVSEKELGNAPE